MATYDARAFFCKFWLCQFPYVSVPYSFFAGPTRAPYWFRRLWKTLEFPCRTRTTTARDSQGLILYGARSLMWPREQRRRNIHILHFNRLHVQEIVRMLKIARGPWLDSTGISMEKSWTGRNSLMKITLQSWKTMNISLKYIWIPRYSMEVFPHISGQDYPWLGYQMN